MSPVFQREWEKSREFDVKGTKVKVLDPVDIIARKLIRLNNYSTYEGAHEWVHHRELEWHMDHIWERREWLKIKRDFTVNGYRECIEEYNHERTILRVMTDSYDINALLKYCAIDPDYFEQAMQEIGKRGHDRRKIDEILTTISTDFSVDELT